MAKVVVGNLADFLENEPTKVECALGTLCVIRTADGFRAVDDMCPTRPPPSPTASTTTTRTSSSARCTRPPSTAGSGQPTEPPATEAVKVYDVSVDGDSVTVDG